MSKILVVAEVQGGALKGASKHAVSLAQAMAEQAGGAELVGLVVGKDTGTAAQAFSKLGLAKVLTVTDADLAPYAAETHAAVVVEVARAVDADCICATATSTGKDLMPRVAALLGAGMASDVSEVLGKNRFKRAILAGNALATVDVLTDTMVVTGRQTDWPPAAEGGADAPIEEVDGGDFEALGAEVVKIELAESGERPDLSEAKVVVSGGRGMQTGDNFRFIGDLADAFGGAMGATRAACDAGLVPNDLQVGQTGKVVAPDLYVAVALSGAVQHLAGMKNSKVIVAINKDPEAPIFQVADYGLVAKWEDTVEALTARVKAVRQGG